MAPHPIPIVDIAPFDHGDADVRRAVVGAVRRACEEIGFFILVGHGVEPAVVDRLYGAARAFFDLPAEVKERVGEAGAVRGGKGHEDDGDSDGNAHRKGSFTAIL